MILVCIVFIVWISVLYSVLKSNDRENKDITGEEYKKTRSRAQVIFKFMINMILIFLLLKTLYYIGKYVIKFLKKYLPALWQKSVSLSLRVTGPSPQSMRTRALSGHKSLPNGLIGKYQLPTLKD